MSEWPGKDMSEGQETRRLNSPRETGWKDRECQHGGTPGARLVSVGMRNTAQGQLWTRSPSPPPSCCIRLAVCGGAFVCRGAVVCLRLWAGV